MTTTELCSDILPSDSKGRVRVSRQRREKLLDEFEQSGMTGAQFARTIGLKYQTFAFWRQRRQKRKPVAAVPAQKTAAVEWLETIIDKAHGSSAVSGSALIVRLPSGALIELASASQASVAAVFVARVGEGLVLSFSGSLKICVALHPIDLRKSFNGFMAWSRSGSRFCIGMEPVFG